MLASGEESVWDGELVEKRRGKEVGILGGTYTHGEGTAKVVQGYPGAGIAGVVHDGGLGVSGGRGAGWMNGVCDPDDGISER